MALDFDDPSDLAILGRLLARADVVIEASRPRALAQLGIDAHVVAATGAAVWLSVSGYGRTFDDGRRVAFGDDAAVAGGLVAGDPRRPCFCADAIADPLAGLVGTAVVLDRLLAGGGWLIDLSMAGVAAWCAREGADREPWAGDVRPPRARTARGTARTLGADTGAIVRELDLG